MTPATTADLEEFIRSNGDLAELEYRLSKFNLFEALGAVREELRHSAYLAFLLNPAERHGVGDQFIREFLKRLTEIAPSFPLNLIDCDTLDFSDSTVQREFKDIDILLTNKTHKFVLAIENKIDATEHNDQLRRYKEIVKSEFPGYRPAFVFLTPDLTGPSDNDYTAADYGIVAAALNAVLKRRDCQMDEDAKVMALHYIDMLGRHIMTDSDISKLAQKVYHAHKAAIDLIIEHIPDQRTQLSDAIATQISKHPSLQVGRKIKTYVSFLMKDLLNVPGIMDAAENYYAGTTPCLLYGEFALGTDYVQFKLIIGPGPKEKRLRLLQHAEQNAALFTAAKGSPGTKYKCLLSKKVLSKDDFDGPIDESISKIGEWWATFSSTTLPEIVKSMSSADLNRANTK